MRILLPNACPDEKKDLLIFEKMKRAIRFYDTDVEGFQTVYPIQEGSQDRSGSTPRSDPHPPEPVSHDGNDEDRVRDGGDSPTGDDPPLRPFHPAKTHRMGKAKAGTLSVWTLQERGVWLKLQQQGFLYVDPSCITENSALLPQYEWLKEQMSKRLPGYQGCFPWWAWHAPKPDLRLRNAYGMKAPGTPMVRLELAVREDRLLLFSDEAWLWVLNGWCVPYDEEDDRQMEDFLLEAGQNPFNLSYSKELYEVVQQTWERIFELERLDLSDCWSARKYVQAVFERLDLDDVVSVTEYTAR